MGKLILLLGLIGSVVAGVIVGGKIDSRDLTGTIEEKFALHSCPAVGMVIDGDPKGMPERLTKCACPEPATAEGKWTVVYVVQDVYDTAANGDRLVISYKEFTPPSGGEKVVALTYTLDRGGSKNTFMVSPAGPIYQTLAIYTAAPLGIGIVLAALVGLVFRGKKSVAA